MKKYTLKDGCYDLMIYDESDDILFSFGGEDEENTNYPRDICLYKKDSKYKHYCEQYSYNYNYIENALLGKREMEIVRITVYQLTKQPVK